MREVQSLTQQRLAGAAQVSLSTVRRLEREQAARLHPETETAIERVLGLRQGGLDHLRAGGSIGEAFESPMIIHLPRSSAYGEAPLSDIALTAVPVAGVMAISLAKLLKHRAQELALLAAGKLISGSGNHPGYWFFDWLPWPAQVHATPVWLDRMMDSAEQVHSVLADSDVPLPLRMAEAVVLQIAHDRARAIDTNSFHHPLTNEELEDHFYANRTDVYEHVNPDRVFGLEWVQPDSPVHPSRWWERAEDMN